MRGLLLALALAFGAMSPVGLAGCASLQAVQPQSAREVLAEAEIAFVGVVTVASDAYAVGAISQEDAQALVRRFDEVAGYLNTARLLLAAGDEAGANRTLAVARSVIRVLSIELSRRAEAHRNGTPA